jgi:PKD repeat protein
VNSNGKVGLDGAGMRVSSGSEKVKWTRLVDPSESGMIAVPRSKGPRSAYQRRSSSRKLSLLLVCAAAMIIVSAVAVVALSREGQTKAGIQALPVASFTTSGAGTKTVSVDGSASTSDTGIVSYSWDWGDTVVGMDMTSSHTYLTTGTYTITLTVTDTLGQTDTASHDVDVVNTDIPPTPFLVYGTTYDSDGVTPLPGCAVNITDVQTRTTLIGTVSDGSGVYYADISLLFQSVGDTLYVNATGPAGQTGSNTSTVPSTPYVGVDVTLTSTVIPEFTGIVMPIVGMIAVLVVARVASSRSEKEEP